jgi:hypothetical protein
MFIEDLLNLDCDIYRLDGVGGDYDWSHSKEGEIVESWELIGTVKCRRDRDHYRGARHDAGYYLEGGRVLYFEPETNIYEGDRLFVVDEQYVVTNVTHIYDFDDELHHHEIDVQLMDWVILS